MIEEYLRIFAHREVAEPLHDGDLAARNAAGDGKRFLRGAGIVVLAGQQKQRAAFGVDLRDPAANVAVDLVEIEVAFENAGSALHVMPQRLPALLVGRIGTDQPGDDGGGDLAAMYVAPVQEI